MISTLPAGDSLFSVPFGLGFTFPLILMQDSFDRDFAVSKFWVSFAVVIVWTEPVMSRISKNVSLPCSRIVLTQPATSTIFPCIDVRSFIIILFIFVYVGLSL